MTEDKFEKLCKQVLIPKLDDLMYRQLTGLEETLDKMLQELVRMGKRVEQIAVFINQHDKPRDV